MWTSFVRCALELTRLETADGGGSNSFSSMLASFTNLHDVPSSTILLSTFRVIILHAHMERRRTHMVEHRATSAAVSVLAVDIYPR